MEMAIESMRQSRAEHRPDGSPSPRVGAVLLRPDGTTETAARGELREGNHAEFTLLERKCVGEKLDDCILFTTLEPCLNRAHPKRGCARHIVSARIKTVYVVRSEEFARRLRQQGLLTASAGVVTPTGFGFLLMGKEPRNAVPQAGVLAKAELSDGKSSRMEFGQAMVLIPEQLEEWLNKVLPSTVDRSRMERHERVDLPFEMIREAVVNALIHRDYDITGQKCQLVVNAHTITIKSPGAPIPPITMEQMRSFSAPMKSRNPVLHYVFARMGLAEEQGFGLTSLKQHAEQLGLPLPSFRMEGDLLTLTIYRTQAGAVAALPPEVRLGLREEETASWLFICSRLSLRTLDLMNRMGFDERKAQRVLKKFVEAGLLRCLGRGPVTYYEVVHP